jgi:nicotinate-nucleotide adenylyltransferase
MTRRIGIYSGTFDPIHEGHIAFGLETMRACGLDRVVLLPERNPRGKNGVSDIAERVARIREMILPSPPLEVHLLGSEQFTVKDTLPEVRRLLGDAELTLLVGSDVVHTFLHRWDQLEVLLTDVSLAIGIRVTQTREEVIDILQQVEKRHEMTIHYTIIETAYAELASSKLRSSAR